MRKIYFLFLFIVLIYLSAATQKPPIQLNWLNSAQEYYNGGDFVANGVTNLSDGSIVVVGYFTGTVDFDPGPDTFTLKATAYYNSFIAKYSNQGKLVFAFGFGGGSSQNFQSANAVIADAENNIYVTGIFRGTVDFDPGAGKTILTAEDDVQDIFLACYTKDGNLKFAKDITDANGYHGNVQANSLAFDTHKNIYVTGWFEGFDVDFDPGINSTHSQAVETDIFFAKYDSDGNFKYVKILSGAKDDFANKIALDKNNNIIICGTFYSAYLDVSADTIKHFIKRNGEGDLFFAKYDTLGKLIFAESIGNYKYTNANGLAVGIDNNIIITGNFYGTNVDFDPLNPGTHLLTSQNSYDTFIAKYNANGSCIFAFTIGNGSPADNGIDIGLDSNNNIFCTGQFGGKNVDFDPGSSIYRISTSSDGYYFLAKYTYSGNFISAVAIGPQVSGVYYNNVRINSLHVTPTGKILTAGYFLGKVDLNAGADTAIVNEPENTMFVCKYDNNNNFLAEINGNNYFSYNSYTTVQNSAIDKAGNLYVCGSFNGRFDFDPGPDKVILESIADTIASYESAGFLAKYSAKGKLVFASVIKGGETDASDIAVDNNENIYVAGRATGYTDFDPGSGIYYINNARADSNIYYAYFFAKYDADGNLVFAKGDGNKSGYYLQTSSIAIDNNKNICVGGTLQGSIDFDPSHEKHILEGGNGGLGNIFFAEYDSIGNYLFAYCIKSQESYGQLSDLKFDNKSTLVITGTFHGTNLDFDQGSKKFLLSSSATGDVDAGFIALYKNNGAFVSVIKIDGQDYSYSDFSHLATDSAGNIYVAGSSTKAADFNPGTDSVFLSQYHEMFFASYNSKLQFRFLKGLVGYGSYTEGNNLNAVTVDKYKNIYIAGEFQSKKVDCDPGPDTALLVNRNYNIYYNGNLFMAKYDSLGHYIYSNQFKNDTTGGSGVSASILVADNGTLYYTGSVRGKVNFGTGNKKVYLQSTSTFLNMFAAQYKQTGFELSASSIASTTKAITNNAVKIYPNPITDKLNIQLNNINQNNATAIIILYDVHGKCVQTNQASFTNYNLNTTIKLPQNLSTGNYFIKIDIEGKKYYSDALIK